MQYLVLYLKGPLQSWGADSRFDLRETMPYPTKSGIFGMLLAASGDSGPQRELLARMANASLSVFSFRQENSAPERLRDFHMVGNGFKENDKWQSLMIPRKSDGSKAVGGGAKLTYRYYLQDKTFAVLLEFPDDLADKFAAALKDPVYDLYLGRKCCAPTEMIFQGNFASENEAVQKIRSLAERDELTPELRIREVPRQEPDARLLNDVPVAFGQHKVYRDRWVLEEPFTAWDPV
ncbi:MAG: type I-E CRISPR-associated protein Cas5/CasD [Lentisphaeria bacterium]|nr:type I-E CRISPR-associated protein Cas5/CasD [Lentisphaeria bacterium]